MRNHQNRSPVRTEVLFQPADHLSIQMVGGLIQKQYIEISGQCSGKHDPSLLPSRQLFHFLIQPGNAQFQKIALNLPFLASADSKCAGPDICPRREVRILRHPGNLKAILADNLSFIRDLPAGNHFKKRRLSRPVYSNNTDLIALLYSEGCVFENDLPAIYFPDMLYINNIHKHLLTNHSHLFLL